MAEQAAGSVIIPSEAPRVKALRVLRRLRKMPIIPTILLGVFIFVGLTAPLISPHDPKNVFGAATGFGDDINLIVQLDVGLQRSGFL